MAAAQELELRGAREYHHPQSKPQSGGNLVPEGPQYRGRTAIEIINEKVYFDSVGYAYRALSWLDLAKREHNTCAGICRSRRAAGSRSRDHDTGAKEDIPICMNSASSSPL